MKKYFTPSNPDSKVVALDEAVHIHMSSFFCALHLWYTDLATSGALHTKLLDIIKSAFESQ